MITIAYQHASEDDAMANAEVLEHLLADGTSFQTGRPLSELYDLVDVATDGTVAIVTARPGPEGHLGTAMSALQRRDVPFVRG